MVWTAVAFILFLSTGYIFLFVHRLECLDKFFFKTNKFHFPEPINKSQILSKFSWALIATTSHLATFYFFYKALPENSLTTLEINPQISLSTIVEAISAILAITISALFLVTQIASDRYGSITSHRFKNEGSSQFLLKLQTLCLIYSSLALVLDYFKQSNNLVKICYCVSCFLFFLSICSIPPTLTAVLSSLRPRGLISWCTKLSINVINFIAKGKISYQGKDRGFLRWKMILLHEALQSLRLIGVVAVREREDEVVHRVLESYKMILEHYFKKISDTKGGNIEGKDLRNLWDKKLSHNLFFRFTSETNVVSSPSEDKEGFDQYWLENNILVSVAKILEASMTSAGGSTYRVRNFYSEFFSLFSAKLNRVETLPYAILQTLVVDFYIIFSSTEITSNEAISIEAQEFFSNRIKKLFKKLVFDDGATNIERIDFDNYIKTVSGFQKAIANTIIGNGSSRVLQLWLEEIKTFYKEINSGISHLDNKEEFYSSLSKSYLRCLLDIFESSMSSKSHNNSKIILQFICFNLNATELEQFFNITTSIVEQNLDQDNKVPSKKTYILVKILIMAATYRSFIINEKLLLEKLNLETLFKELQKPNICETIKINIFTHLEFEVISFYERGLQIAIPEPKIKQIQGEIWKIFKLELK